jgi:2-amino-4-hydroxy-6-hydroxymethyldihydropteridine diphosphokinase
VTKTVARYSYLIAVGSNLGDRRETVHRAQNLLVERGLTITATSELVETAPIGAADRVFLNGAFVCDGDIAPDDLMRLLLDVENSLGRVRDVRWGNRAIDLDVLLVRNADGDSIESKSAILSVPHPRLLERDFMLRPAAAVAGHWVLPHSDQTLRALCISRGWRPNWNNLKGDIKLWQALKGDVFSATTSRWWWPLILAMLLFRIWVAAKVPFGNDEAYYWDWGRAPQASYFDHPPFVSWLSLFSMLAVFSWTEGPLQGRLLTPFLHVATTLMFGALLVRLTRRVLTNLESRCVLLVSQLVPAFSLGGFMLMPDVGLILFSTMAVWLVLAISRRSRLRWWTGVILGVVLGLAGLSKYHAALIGGGLLAWLFWRRQETFEKELAFWAWLIVVGLLCISPVIGWNATHDWASFRYQGARGVSGGGFEVMRAVRTLLGEILFLGPVVVGGLWLTWKSRKEDWPQDGSIILWSSLPMLFVLKLFSFTTQTLPHWSMPSLWLLSVLIVPTLAVSPKIRFSGKVYGAVFCLFIPLFMSSVNSRRALLRWMGDRPGGLGEMTLWDSASRDPELLEYVNDHSWIDSPFTGRKLTDQHCDRGLVLAAPRWFTVAQVAANLPGHPLVETLDQDHKSYYHYRPKASMIGCPVVILSEKSHWRDDEWHGTLDISMSREFEIDGHRDRRVVIGRGWFLAESADSKR